MFAYKGFDLPVYQREDRESRTIEIWAESRVVEVFDENDRDEALFLVADLNSNYYRAVDEIATNPLAGHPAERLTFPGTTTEEICEAMDLIYRIGGEGHVREHLTPLFEADLIRFDRNDRAWLTEDATYAWLKWEAIAMAAGHKI